MSDNVLDEIFAATEEDVETFADFVEQQSSGKMTEKESEKVRSTASFSTETQKHITVEHGRHEAHYAWHITPANPKRGWPSSMKNMIFAATRVVCSTLPQDVLVDIYLPSTRDACAEVLTIRANDVLDHWNVQPDDLTKITGRLFEVINAL